MGFLNHPFNYINRYRKIVAVLIKYGFGDLVDSINVGRYFPFLKTKQKLKGPGKRSTIYSLTRWERMRLVLEELGTTFIKFGQIMSNRPDLLPPGLITELEKLQDKVPPFEAEKARSIIEEELEDSIENLFSRFDAEPFSSASIAQVHYAELLTGESVVVKVQRPYIQKIAQTDIEIMTDLAVLINRYVPSLSIFDPVGIVKTFEKTMRKELNFTMEAAYIDRFANNFREEQTLYTPACYKKLSSEKVITLEYIDGTKVSGVNKLKEEGYDLKLLAKRGFDLYLQQVFDHGFFHADPHPGNILVLPDHSICFIDFGMMGFIMEEDRDRLVSMLIGIEKHDARMIIAVLKDLSGDSEFRDERQLEYDLSEFLNEYAHQNLEDVSIQEIIGRIREIIVKYQIKIHPDFFLLMKALVTIEGVGKRLAPDFNPFEQLRPYVIKLERRRLNPFRILRSLYSSAYEFSNFVKDLPYDLKDLIDQIKEGKVNVDIEHKGLEPFLVTFDQVSNRIAFAIMVASLIIGSALIVLSGVPPVYNEIPVIGIAGFVVAGIMALWLLISIIRHRKL